MNDVVSIRVLEERFLGLQAWLDERFSRLDDRFDQLADERSIDIKSVAQLAKQVADHETRLVRLERIAWLLIGLGTFFAPVVIWAVIEIIKAVVK